MMVNCGNSASSTPLIGVDRQYITTSETVYPSKLNNVINYHISISLNGITYNSQSPLCNFVSQGDNSVNPSYMQES